MLCPPRAAPGDWGSGEVGPKTPAVQGYSAEQNTAGTQRSPSSVSTPGHSRPTKFRGGSPVQHRDLHLGFLQECPPPSGFNNRKMYSCIYS